MARRPRRHRRSTWPEPECPRDSPARRCQTAAPTRCTDAGHCDHVNPGERELRELLASAAEDERVAALQPDHEMAGAGQLDEPGGDVILLSAFLSSPLPDPLEPSVGSAEGESFWRDESVVQHVIGVRQQLAGLDRDQRCIAGSGADEDYPSSMRQI